MKGVYLSPTIDYLAMEDEEGPVGVMIFRGTATQPSRVVSIEDQDQFKSAYNEFRTYEDYA
tara:strand:+ start:3192 stop:3374 length:183 start_codon:yes stop_codon:yes gene_type:complete